MNWKQFVKDYLSFNRRERIGLLVLVFIIVVIFLLPVVVNNNRSKTRFLPADTAWISAARKLEIKETESKDQKAFNPQYGDNEYAYQYDHPVTKSPASLFYFDPNTLAREDWKKLGIKDKTIRIIQNYLSKNGHFYKPEDLQKVYGLRQNDYERLAPYIKIATGKFESNPGEYVIKENTQSHFSRSVIDINSADTSAFISLPGIGNKLAARIVNFRDKLGGFYSVTQVRETYGLQDSVFQKIKQYLKIENTTIKKININTATVDELKVHPYIKYNIANPIVAYRNEHGPFSKTEDIKKVMAVTDEIYNKISPYLVIQ